MSNSKFATIKVVFGSDIRRVVVAPRNFAELRNIVLSTFPALGGKSFIIKYIDEESEWITAQSDLDLVEAFNAASAEKKLPKFMINVEGSSSESLSYLKIAPESVYKSVSSAPQTPKPQSAAPAPKVVEPVPAFPTSAPSTPAAPSVPEANEPALPSINELIQLLQEFISGEYTKANNIFEEELPAVIQVFFSEANLSAEATVQSAVNTALAASVALQNHPVVQRLLPLLDHRVVLQRAQGALQHLRSLSSEQLAQVREHAVLSINQVQNFVFMLPILLPSLLARVNAVFGSDMEDDEMPHPFHHGPPHDFAFPHGPPHEFPHEGSFPHGPFPHGPFPHGPPHGHFGGHHGGPHHGTHHGHGGFHGHHQSPAAADDFSTLSVHELKAELSKRGVAVPSNVIEKSELIQLLQQSDLASTSGSSSSTNEPEVQGMYHYGVTCDNCGTQPVVGIRFKCNACPNYDLCQNCKSIGAHKETSHSFQRIADPRRSWWRSRGGLGGFGGFGHHFGGRGGFGPWRGGWGGVRRCQPQRPAPAKNVCNGQFIRDVTLPDRTVVGVDRTLIKTWLVSNNGAASWPPGTHLAFHRGDRQIVAEESFPIATEVPVGANVEVSAVLKTPAQGGRYSAIFYLKDLDGRIFGPRLWVDLLVQNEDNEGVPLQQGQAQPQQPAAVPQSQAYSQQMNHLESLGFGLAPATMETLLEANNGDVNAIVSHLLGN